MRVFDVTPSSKGPLAFEVNASLGRKHAVDIVSNIPGVRVLRRPKIFTKLREEVFCEFELSGEKFNIWEPYGNSGRYWIGPSNGTRTPVLMVVRQVFIDYKLPGPSRLAIWKRQGKGIS